MRLWRWTVPASWITSKHLPLIISPSLAPPFCFLIPSPSQALHLSVASFIPCPLPLPSCPLLPFLTPCHFFPFSYSFTCLFCHDPLTPSLPLSYILFHFLIPLGVPKPLSLYPLADGTRGALPAAASGPLDVPGSRPHHNLISLASCAVALEAALMELSSAFAIVCFFFFFSSFSPFFLFNSYPGNLQPDIRNLVIQDCHFFSCKLTEQVNENMWAWKLMNEALSKERSVRMTSSFPSLARILGGSI